MSPGAAGRVLVTGGSGLIGRPLVAGLAAAGHEVVVLSRRPDAVGGLPPGARAAGWDGAGTAGWGGLADGALAVVNLAGESVARWPWTAARKRRIRDSRLRAGAAVRAAVEAAATPPRVLLQASASGYYGDTGDAVVAESHPPGDDFLARTCVEWEAATAPLEALGVRRAVLRTGIVLAADGGALPAMARPFRFFVGGPLGDGRQYVPWIHLADEVAAILFLLAHPAGRGPFNLAAPEPATNGELARELGRALGRPSRLRAPEPVLRAVLGDMAPAILASQRVVPARLAELGFAFRFPRLAPALADLFPGR